MANGDPETDLLNAIRRQENANPKYNNPGNLKPSGFTYEGQTGLDPSGIAIFDSPESGEKALRQQIRKNAGRGLTLKEFFGGGKGYPGYAPKADNNDPVAYAKNVSTWTGIDPDTPLDKIMPQQQNYDDMSLEDLLKLQKNLKGQLDTLKAQRAAQTQQPQTRQVSTQQQGPPVGKFEAFAREGFGTIPAYETGKRAFTDPDWRDKISDVIEAGGHLGPLIGAGSVAAAGMSGGLAAIPEAIISLAAAYGGSYAASKLADMYGGYANLDPKTRRLVDDLAGVAGGLGGYKAGVPTTKLGVRTAYNVGTSPITGGLVAGGFAKATGIPEPGVVGILGRKILPKAVEAMTPEALKDWAGINKPPTAPVSPPPGGTTSGAATGAAPTGTVKPPKTFQDPVYDKLAQEGHLPIDRYEEHLRKNGVPEDIIEAKLAKVAKIREEEEAKNAPPPVTLKPQPPPNPPPPSPQMHLPGMEPPGPVTPSDPGINVRVPPGVQAVMRNGEPMGNQLKLPLDGGPPQPVQQNLPGTGQLQPNAPQPPLAPAQQGLPFGPVQPPPPTYQPELPFAPETPGQMGLPGVLEPFEPTKSPTLQLPGQGPGPAPPMIRPPEINPGNIGRVLPFGKREITQEMPPPTYNFEANAGKIADLAEEFNSAPPKPTNKLALTRWLKRLDFVPNEREWIRAKEIYQSRKVGTGARSRMP